MNEKQLKEIPGMFDGNIYRLLTRLSLPILTGMVVKLLYNITDTFFISLIDKNDPSYIGGTGMVFPLLFFAISLASGIMTGVGSVVARAIGEKNHVSLNKAADSAFALGMFLSLLILGTGLLFAKPLVSMLGAQGAYFERGLVYFKYMVPFAALMVALHAVAGIFQGEGKMKRIMTAMMIGTVVNVILDPIFIFVLKWEVRGAALASVAGQLIAFIYVLVSIGAKDNIVQIKWSVKDISFKLMGEIIVIGFPMALGQMAMAISMVLFNHILI
ncbi:MAG: MATE family efflux transporter, partial [Fibrobacter sp.]|nr:MATE family efflux transporter [Fibrobacter sp.]